MQLAAPLVLLLVVVAAEGQDDQLQQLQDTVRSLSDQLAAVSAQLTWFNEQPHFKQWVENNNFDEELSKNLLTEITGSLDDLDNRVYQTEEQLQCSASERLQVCKPKEWVTITVGGVGPRTTKTERETTDAVQVLGGHVSLTLPNYPSIVFRNRVFAIGSKVYSCGGGVDAKNSNECLMIDLNDKRKTWQKSYQLPRKSWQHYVSVANGDIMAIYEDGSMSVTNGNDSMVYEGFVEGSLQLQQWQSCLASNSSHSYFFHAGGNVYVNDNASDPSNWKIISTEIKMRQYPFGTACLLLDSQFYISQLGLFFIMNTDTYAVKQRASPNAPRHWHGMGVIDGRVAMFGGEDESEHLVDTIETYDSQTDTWRTLQKKMEVPVSHFGSVSLLL